MNPRYRTLAQRILTELEDVERSATLVCQRWDAAGDSDAHRGAYLDSVALNLHGFYSGLERIFELIAVELDGGTLGGEAWHRQLLEQIAEDVPDVRPPVISAQLAADLDDFRRVRHVVRNIYADHLDEDRLEPLVTRLPTVMESIDAELRTFAAFLTD